MIKSSFVVSFIFLIFIYTSTLLAQGQGAPSSSPTEQLNAVLNAIEMDQEESDRFLREENFEQAGVLTEQGMEKLKMLIEVFMPIHERIKKLLETEREILTGTEGLALLLSDGDIHEIPEQKRPVLFAQKDNVDAARKTLQLLEKHLQSMAMAPDQQQQQAAGGKKEEQQKQLRMLEDVQALVTEALSAEEAATDQIGNELFDDAILSEKEAIEKLEEALKKFQQDSKQNQQKNQQQNQQNQDQQNQKQQKDQKQNQQQNQQNQNQQQDSKNNEQQAQKKKEKKLSPKEALKELNKLRQKADKERKLREKKYGVIQGPQTVPVDKDW